VLGRRGTSSGPFTRTPSEPSSPPSATPAAVATPAPSAAGLPSFALGAPLVAFNRLTGAGGGLFVARPDGTDMQQLATDVLPGVHKRVDWSPDGQHIPSNGTFESFVTIPPYTMAVVRPLAQVP
jgi:hypothetical protein